MTSICYHAIDVIPKENESEKPCWASLAGRNGGVSCEPLGLKLKLHLDHLFNLNNM